MKNQLKRILKKSPRTIKYYHLLKRVNTIFKTTYTKSIKGKGNQLKIHKDSVFSHCKFDIIGNNNEIILEESSTFRNVTFYIRGNNNKIKISNNVKFNRGGSIWIEDFNCSAIIGEHSTFEDVHIAVTEPNSKIRIGKDCMFAYDIDLRTGDSHSIINSITKERINFAKDINIGDHVWIASHVSILKGSLIPNNSIIATRSVVTNSFTEEGILIGGIPSRKIKANINWDRQRIYRN